MDDLYYGDYIQLDTILNSQQPRSFEKMEDGNDEMLFIVIHQTYELSYGWTRRSLNASSALGAQRGPVPSRLGAGARPGIATFGTERLLPAGAGAVGMPSNCTSVPLASKRGARNTMSKVWYSP